MSDYQGIYEFISWILIVGGTFFVMIGAIGTLRFPDFWARLHAASVTESAGVILLILTLVVCAVTGSPPEYLNNSERPSFSFNSKNALL